jgi:serine protease Do
MKRWAAPVVAVLSLMAAVSAAAQTSDPRTAVIARATTAVVEIRVEPKPQTAPPKRVIRLSEGDCTETGGTWLGNRRCEVADAPFPFPPVPRTDSGQMGSGFFFDAARGLILTADHILGEGRPVTVKLADGRELPAAIAGRDPATGLAVLRVEAADLRSDLPIAPRSPVPGDASLLVGRLLPYDSTIATSGMVGGKLPRDEPTDTLPWLADIWLIDNLLPGGGLGGGPVLNSSGEVMGLATAIFGRDGYGQSAATIMVALHGERPVIEALASKGVVERSQIGTSLDCAKNICTVTVIFPGSNAEAGGLRVGDRVVSIDGRPFTAIGQITRYIAARPIGATLQVAIERDGAAQTLGIVTASSNALPAPPKE